MTTTTTTSPLADDTICAISTPAGTGGIAVIRLSGPDATGILAHLWRGKALDTLASHTAHLGTIIDTDSNGETLDQAVVTPYLAPRSFTGENVVEISIHGSRYIQQRLLALLIKHGARLAEPGEFTRRAFANGRLDLAQAEAVADVIAADSRASLRLAQQQMKGDFSRRLRQLRDSLLNLASLLELELDFSEEEVEFVSRTQLRRIAAEIHTEVTRLHQSFTAGNAIKEGIPVAIVGPTNAGKSSLLNALTGDQRAIVSDIHGTTRDTIEETVTLGPYKFRLIDTAGLRDTADPIERLGITRTHDTMRRAAIILRLHDITLPLPADLPLGTDTTDRPLGADTTDLSLCTDTTDRPTHSTDSVPTLLLLTKTDLHSAATPGLSAPTGTTIPISTHTGEGLDTLRERLIRIADTLTGSTSAGATVAGGAALNDTLIVTNARHAAALGEAATLTASILTSLDTSLPGDLIAQDLRATIAALSTITGDLTTSDILSTIFSRFCIGK